jgi:hypothetical protein
VFIYLLINLYYCKWWPYIKQPRRQVLISFTFPRLDVICRLFAIHIFKWEKKYLDPINSQQTQLCLNLHVFNNCYITDFLITNELCVHPYLWWTLKRTEPLLSLVLGRTISTLHLTASLLAHYLNPYCHMSLFGRAYGNNLRQFIRYF